MMNHIFEFTWEKHIGDEQVGEAEVRITYACSRGRPATRIDPPEYPEIEIVKVEMHGWVHGPHSGENRWIDAGYLADEFSDYALDKYYDDMVGYAFESEQAAADDAAENSRED